MFLTGDIQAQCSGISGSFIYDNQSGAGHSITPTFDGGYIIGGQSNNLNPTLTDWLIIRTDGSFNPLWSRVLGFNNTSESGTNFVARELPDGRIAAIGYQLQGSARRGTIMILTAEGELIQAVRLPAQNSTPRDVIGLNDGSIVICGTISGDGGASDDAFVLKYSSTYVLQWYKRFNASSGPNDHFYGVTIATNGNLFLVGGSQIQNSTHSGYLVEMDQLGSIVNQRRYSSSSLIQFLTIRDAPGGGFIIGAHMNIGSLTNGLVFRLNPNLTIAWSISIRQGNKTYIPVVDFDNDGNVIAALSNEFQNGSKSIGFAKINFADGTVMTVSNPAAEDSHEAQIISHTAARNSAGGFVSVGSKNGNVSIVAFDNCLLNECSQTDNYILPPLTVNVANVALSEVNPVLPEPSSPFSQFTEVSLTSGSCITCNDELDVTEVIFCAGIQDEFQVNLNGAELLEASNVLWSFSNGVQSDQLSPALSFLTPGTITYTLNLTTSGGCSYTFNGSFDVTELPTPPDMPDVLNICQGGNEVLDFSVFTDFVEIIDPSGNQITDNYTFTGPGAYSFSFISPCTTYVETVNVQWIDIPALLPSFPSDFCLNQNVQFSILNWASISGQADLIVNLGNGQVAPVTGPAILTVYSVAGNYTITISGTINGCDVSEAAQVSIVAPIQFVIPGSLVFCTGELATVDFTGFGFPVHNEAGQTIQSFSTSAAGTYTFSAQNGCGAVSQTIDISEVVFTPLPFNSFSQICPSTDTIEIGFMNHDYLFQWSTSAETSAILVSESGNYSVQVSDLSGTCNSDYFFTVTAFQPIPTRIFPQPEITLCEEGSRSITPPYVGVPYTFSDGSEGYNFVVDESGILTAAYADLCYRYEEEVSVFIKPCLCPVFVPNSFTPNADGINDIFKATADCPLLNFRMIIFNRWGNEVFESNDINTGWNGSSPNADFYGSEGVYFYLIRYSQDLEGLEYPSELQGHLTMLR